MSKHELLRLRSLVVRAIRAYFDNQDFLEVHTPRLVGLPGQEPYLEPMWTRVHSSLSSRTESDAVRDLATPPIGPDPSCVGMTKERNERQSHRAALITSPEYAMKKLLGSGLDKIYDLGPCFRDGEPWDSTHDPEFLLLEWYRRNAGLEELMNDAEEMIRFVMGQLKSIWGGAHIPLLTKEGLGEVGSFRRLSVRDAMKQYAGVELDPLLANRDAMANIVREHGHTVTNADTWDDLFFKIFLSEVEPHLGWSDQPRVSSIKYQVSSDELSSHTRYSILDTRYFQPTFLHTYPASMAALARKDPSDPRYALRTELYIGDLELANGFAELCDPVEQRARFEEERALRASLGKDTWPLDERLLAALPNMGTAAGIAFGVDRLVMLIAGISSISDLMPIPVRERFQ